MYLSLQESVATLASFLLEQIHGPGMNFCDSHNLTLRLLPCFLLLSVFFASTVYPVSVEVNANAVSVKRDLSARLDSLEMEKQARKRRGESIGDLELESKSVRDLIAQTRQRIAEETQADPGQSPAGGKHSVPGVPISWIPASLFDWIILVVGGIAALAGIVLVVGLLRSLVRRMGGRSRPAGPRVKAAPARRSVGRSERGTLAGGADSETPQREIELLRQRVRSDVERLQRFNDREESPLSRLDHGVEPSSEEGAAEKRAVVARAAREGMGVQEISRKFHMSVDQVSLILRVTGRGNSGGGK